MLTRSFPMHTFSTPRKHKIFWCFQEVERGCIGNKFVKKLWMFPANESKIKKSVPLKITFILSILWENGIIYVWMGLFFKIKK